MNKYFIIVSFFMLSVFKLSATDKDLVLSKINEVREQGCKCGKSKMPAILPVVWNDTLVKVAQLHANDMNKRNYFSHKSPKGSTPLTRANKIGYKYTILAENIAKGQKNEAEVIDSWIKSEGHCKNIMLEKIKEIGLAKAGEYWVLVLGASD